jgi:predicted Zn-dependent peptidase
MAVSFDAGYASDPRDKLGLSSFASSLFDEGTPTRSAVQIGEEANQLGAILGSAATADRTGLSLSALRPNLEASLALYADILRNASFPPAEIERLRAIRLASIAQERAQPIVTGVRELPPLVYGPQHPYGVPLTGSGTPETVGEITREDVLAYRDRWLRPDNATLFVAGDITLAELKPMLERALGGWRASPSPKGVKTFAAVTAPAASRIVVLDRPGSPQSVILGGAVLRSRGVDDLLAFTVANDILGGVSTSRLNTDLRETKGWAYGAGSLLLELQDQSPVLMFAPVQTDRTADSLKAIVENVRAYNTDRPITAAELERAVNNRTRSLPSSFDTTAEVLAALESNAVLNRPDTYQEQLAARLRRLTPRDVTAASASNLDPAKLTWLVVGDRTKIEAPLRALELGTVEVRAAPTTLAPGAP